MITKEKTIINLEELKTTILKQQKELKRQLKDNKKQYKELKNKNKKLFYTKLIYLLFYKIFN